MRRSKLQVFMKRTQNTLTTLVILQVASVLLLGVMAVLNYQSQAEVGRLRADVVAFQQDWQEQMKADAELPLSERLAQVESRLGLRDTKADQTAAALQRQMQESSALAERFNALRKLPPPTGAEVSAPATAAPTGRPGSPALPAPKPLAPKDNLSPAEQAIAALPIVAEITDYDQNWEFYTINKGQLDGVSKEVEYAVRRKDGYELLANVKVSSLNAADGIVEVVRSTTKPGAPKPATGDLIIDISKLK